LKYINRQNWQDTPRRKGTLQRVLVSPNGGSSDAARAQWQEGDYALAIHLFGGIGGENKEFAPLGTVTGHFSYGLARVVREPITNDLQLEVQYQQVYAHNGGGIVSGTHDWADYMGDMQRGWLGLRPVSDIVIKLDSFIRPFQLGDVTISLFRELLVQTQVMAARYRTGDGTGFSGVTPATSCVQDSNQALFIAIQQIRRQIEQNPQVTDWLLHHSASPEAQRAREFIALGQDLEALLTPYGVIRPDWQSNADTLAGIDPTGHFSNNRGLFSGALSWQSMMPRWAHDAVARVFLRHGGQLWFLRTNMAGGDDPRIEPIPPTGLMGGIPVVGTVAQRLADAFVTWPQPLTILLSLLGVGLYGAVALPFGRRTGFLVGKNAMRSPLYTLLAGVRLWFVPCLGEELIFRVALLPHPMEGVPGWRWLLWTVVSVALFVLYHHWLGKRFYREAKETLQDRRFLTLVGWLGLMLSGLYWITGSLWLLVWVHWAVVVIWMFTLGGYDRMPRIGRRAPKSDPALPAA
jgi:predicted Abi (CAAX) family protease